MKNKKKYDNICHVFLELPIKKGDAEMKRKLLLLSATICILMLGLTGCGHEHIWEEATCLTPKTCSECGATEGETVDHKWINATCKKAKYCEICGATEGEPLEHEWENATCENATKCKVCGETEGEPLGHEWINADYINPQTCSVCGKTQGDRLKTFSEKYDIILNKELNKEVIFQTLSAKSMGEQETVKGNISFEGIRCVEHEGQYQAKEGYEWRIVNCSGIFDPSEYSAIDGKGVDFGWGYTDLTYGINFVGEMENSKELILNNGQKAFSETWTIDDSEIEILTVSTFNSGWKDGKNNRVRYMNLEYAMQVPTDFKGLIFYLRSSEFADVNTDMADYIEDEKFIFFDVDGCLAENGNVEITKTNTPSSSPSYENANNEEQQTSISNSSEEEMQAILNDIFGPKRESDESRIARLQDAAASGEVVTIDGHTGRI
ncbi:MAG: hypothetical protein NC489_44140, partial [Ruminococcus flavefaciens]|nr:hypothetical protein [Ruminococcus flavefaciens]